MDQSCNFDILLYLESLESQFVLLKNKKKKLWLLHYGVEMGQVAQVFFCDYNRYNTTRLDTLQGNFFLKV